MQAETGRIYSDRLQRALREPSHGEGGANWYAAARSAKSSTSSARGRTCARLETRPEWFFQRERYGGILCDIGSHQFDQFLYFSGETNVEIVASQVANYHHPQHPELEDFGDVMLRGEHCTGYIRVDWFTPDGLPTWGDGTAVRRRQRGLCGGPQVPGHRRTSRQRPSLPGGRRRGAVHRLLGCGAAVWAAAASTTS